MRESGWYSLAGIALAALFTYLGVRATNRSNLKSAGYIAEEKAYLRAKELYEAGRHELEQQLTDVRTRVTNLEHDLQLALSGKADAERRLGDLSRRYLAVLACLRDVLAAAGTPRQGEPTRRLPDVPDEITRDLNNLT